MIKNDDLAQLSGLLSIIPEAPRGVKQTGNHKVTKTPGITKDERELSAAEFSHHFLSRLKGSQTVMASTGAGISAESGVPTFRGPGGLWNDFKPEELATPEAFQRDPRKVWQWYDWRRSLLVDVEPNPGHAALAELESIIPRFFLFTQNIDGLHQKAGSKKVYELHGNIWNVRCVNEKKTFPLPETPLKELPPLCDCGATLRPDVVWFGEMLPADVTEMAWDVARRCDVFFMIGSSATVQPAASLAWVAKQNDAVVAEINPEVTPITEIADESFRGNSGAILPRLIEALKNLGAA